MTKTQPESYKVANPMKRMMKDLGWTFYNINPGTHTDTFPDTWAGHPIYGERWIEWKVRYDNTVHLTTSQKKVFPIQIKCGMRIWCIAASDLRGTENYSKRKKMYNKLFEEPNGYLMLLSSLHRELF